MRIITGKSLFIFASSLFHLGNEETFQREIFAWHFRRVWKVMDNEMMISKTLAAFQTKVAVRCKDNKNFRGTLHLIAIQKGGLILRSA